MLSPCLLGILVNTGGLEYRFPKKLDRAGCSLAGEHLLRPLHAGNSRNAPLILVLHLIADRLDHLVARPERLCVLLLIYAAETVGILRNEIYSARQGIGVMLKLCDLPIIESRKSFERTVADMIFLKRLMRPLDGDLAGARLVAFVRQHFNEFRLIKLRLNYNVLPLPDFHADSCNKLRVFSENSLFHMFCPFRIIFSKFVDSHRRAAASLRAQAPAFRNTERTDALRYFVIVIVRDRTLLLRRCRAYPVFSLPRSVPLPSYP